MNRDEFAQGRCRACGQILPPTQSRTPALNLKIVDDDIGERAARFLERYQALYTLHRNGARCLIKPSLDWSRCCELCALWDSARLEKLAIVFLTTDEDWISRSDRGFGVFCSRASWCDDRLRAAETGAA